MTKETYKPGKECIKCGSCMTVCPVFQNTHMEADVARGRLAVLKQGEKDEKLARSAIMRDVLTRCLLCGACENVCANKVPAPSRVIQGREIARKRFNLPKQVQLAALMDQGLKGGLLRTGGKLAQGLLGGKIDKSSGLYLRFPASFFTGRKVIPAFTSPSWLEQKKGADFSGPGLRIGFFVGCGTDHLFQQNAQALERLGKEAGLNIITVPGQGCCGLPAYAGGDRETAIACAKRNLDAFSALDLDAVATVCASCGSQIQNLPQLFEDDPEYLAKAEKMAAMHQDAAQILLDAPGFQDLLKQINAAAHDETPRIYYHTPCHLRFGKGASSAPLDLLKSLDQRIDLIPPGGLTQCCGHGGGFNIDHHDLSLKIHQSGLNPILEQSPEKIVTGCTGCLMQFMEGVFTAKRPHVEICHPLVLVDTLLK
ncbi:(Fe-S)-binding protein [Desulfatibacillum aliphaticivorans]|uniref:(Fe-S)-binding protein n=1 Tax=Desulfatibacillum aliphaticivorans TaxID=218208 RepID=UPI00041E6D0E|nr:(Fe-S)-binding protein [Desulfatibacillum aliphaticivorans]